MVEGHGDVVIPENTRVASSDGVVVFYTLNPTPVATGLAYIDVDCEAQVEGVLGNNYQIGDINVVLDPQAFITSAANTNVTVGGSDLESDDQLRIRIKQAPDSFSVAGPKGAYIFWAKSANSLIIDVAVPEPTTPGTVNVYPLVQGGITTPDEILDAVAEVLNSDTIRPLCDTVVVSSPTAVNYSITANLTLFPDAIQSEVEAKVLANLQAFVLERSTRLGLDILKTRLTKLCMEDKVYDVAFPGFTDLIITPTQFGKCTSITVTTVGINNG
jgi:phage-related baseplate assembly protein